MGRRLVNGFDAGGVKSFVLRCRDTKKRGRGIIENETLDKCLECECLKYGAWGDLLHGTG